MQEPPRKVSHKLSNTAWIMCAFPQVLYRFFIPPAIKMLPRLAITHPAAIDSHLISRPVAVISPVSTSSFATPATFTDYSSSSMSLCSVTIASFTSRVSKATLVHISMRKVTFVEKNTRYGKGE